jgi:hypothetical protein
MFRDELDEGLREPLVPGFAVAASGTRQVRGFSSRLDQLSVLMQ